MGTTFDADVVVGADGVHSRVRDWVTGGDEPVYSGTSGFRGLVPVERLPRLPDPGALQFWMGPGAHLLHYPVSGGSVINFLAVVDGPGRWTAPAWMEAAEPGAHLEAFAGWHPAVTEMIGAAPQSPRWGLFARGRWGTGTAGRSCCWAMPRTRCCRTTGRARTRRSRTPSSWPRNWRRRRYVQAALHRYTGRRRVRTRQVQLMSWAASAALHLPDGPAAQRRDAGVAQLPERVAWIHGHDAFAPAGAE